MTPEDWGFTQEEFQALLTAPRILLLPGMRSGKTAFVHNNFVLRHNLGDEYLIPPAIW